MSDTLMNMTSIPALNSLCKGKLVIYPRKWPAICEVDTQRSKQDILLEVSAEAWSTQTTLSLQVGEGHSLGYGVGPGATILYSLLTLSSSHNGF